MELIKPNFFIIGGPKCGTTSLANYLSEHPQVFFSKPKELHFFASDLLNGTEVKVHTLEDYYKHFNQIPKDCHAIGEGSVSYLYSKTAVKNILDFNPSSRFIVMLRDPTQMAIALHAQLLFTLDEEIDSFQNAWNLQNKRAEGIEIPKTCKEPQFLQYKDVCALGSQMERLLKVVPKSQVHVIFLEDLKETPEKVFRSLLEFLEVDETFLPHFKIHNARKTVRNRSIKAIIQKFYNRVPKPVEYSIKRFKSFIGISDYSVFKILVKLNSKPVKTKTKIDPAFIGDIRATFRSEVLKLQQICNRDLSHWI